MYLQITTKCQMHCAHCCYSCNKNGKHMERHVWQQAVRFAEEYDSEVTVIGGGEPTLHPDFFEILRRCLDNFNYVWMATNGGRTKTMRRLADILDGEDYQEDEEGIFPISQEQFCVALSLDYFHDPINEKIEALWKRRAEKRGSGYEIRDVTKSPNSPIGVGRAKKTNSGWATGCCCSEVQIIPSGKIKLCGCRNSPIIGDVHFGIEDKWKEYMDTDKYRDTNCFNGEPISAHT